MKHIIIFGGAGFIGTNLIQSLIEENKIICVDNFCTGRQSNIDKYIGHSNFILLEANINDGNCYNTLYDIVKKFMDDHVDHIYNLACPASPVKYLKSPLETIRTSISVQQIGAIAFKYNAILLHASTSEVYGNPDIKHHPQNETYNGNVNIIGPRSCYDEGKRIAETILYEYRKLGVKSKIIRIFNTYGPYMDPNDGRVISNFVCQALTNKDITIYGDGSQTRSFQYIDDLIIGMKEFIEIDENEFGPVNIGNPTEFTISELANLVLELIPESTSKIIYKDLPVDDPIQRKADISKAYKMFGYTPKIDLRSGLEKTIQYFKEELNNVKFEN